MYLLFKAIKGQKAKRKQNENTSLLRNTSLYLAAFRMPALGVAYLSNAVAGDSCWLPGANRGGIAPRANITKMA